MSSGACVLGLLNGLTIGLLAVGLVLVYKSNRFLNLAHAQLGALSALLLAKFVLDWGWNWWLAFVVAVALGAVTGVVVDRLLVERLRRLSASPIRMLLLSLGISQLLLALTYVPDLGPDTSNAPAYPQPFQPHLRVGGVALSGVHVLTACLVPTVVGGLAVFMRYSMLGKQVRAAASNPDAARLCGISVSSVSSVVWAIAGAFSAVSAVLQAPTQATFNAASLGPELLMVTLGAAAFGAFVSIPQALAGGLALGLVYQVVAEIRSSGADAQLVVFGVILLIVFVRGRAIARVFSTAGAVVEDRPMVRVPQSVRGALVVRCQPLALGLTALAFALVWPHLPYFRSAGNQFLLSLILVYALIGVALTMLIGWGGQVSLGHFAIVGLGAYLTARWSPGMSLTGLILSIGAVGAAVMVVVGLPALRVRGLTLAVTTLGFAVIASDWLFLQPWLVTKRAYGLAVEPPRIASALGVGAPSTQVDVYYVALVVLVLAVLAAAALRRSSPGRIIVAVRDNERASAAFGISPPTIKLAVLAVSGAFCAVAGVLWALAWHALSPSQFFPDVSIAALAIPVIGGLGSIAGAVAAAVMLYTTTYFVGPHVSGLFGDLGHNLGFSLFLAGSGVTFTLLRFPTGIAGAAQRAWQSRLERMATTIEARRRDVADAEPLAVRGVHVNFGGIVALDDPDIVVREGEIVGLIGSNGAGKTTLMNVISGVVRPDRGSVQVFGKEIVHLAPDFRLAFGLGRSFQDASLFSGLTVRETIQVAAAQHHKVGVVSAMMSAPWVRHGERQSRRNADEVMDRFGLAPWADARAAELSTGTRRICELAAQVAARPKVLLLDEPTAGVAQREAERFGPLLRQIRDELGCAVLIVEHDMPLLMGLCDRVYAMEIGRVIAEGTPDEVRANPLVVSSYLGTDPTAIARSGDSRRQTRRAPITAGASVGGAGE